MKINHHKPGRVPKLQYGDIVAVRATGFAPFAWFIWRRTRGPWNHVAISIGPDHLCQALPKGVDVDCAGPLKTAWWVQLRHQKPITNQHRIWMDEFLSRQIGKGYDWLGVFGFTFLSPSSNHGHANRWFCSELVAACYEYAKRPLLKRTKPSLISPSDIVESPVLCIVDFQWPKELIHWIEPLEESE